MNGSSFARESASKRHLDRIDRVCRVHGRDQHTHRPRTERQDVRGNSLQMRRCGLKLIHTATPDTTRLPRRPVDRRRRDAGQAGSYA